MRFCCMPLESATPQEVKLDRRKVTSALAGFAMARPGGEKGGVQLEESMTLLVLLVNGQDVYGISACEPWYNASR